MKLSTTNKWQFFGVDVAQLYQFFVQGLSDGIPVQLKNAFASHCPSLIAHLSDEQIDFVLEDGDNKKQLASFSPSSLSTDSVEVLKAQLEKYTQKSSDGIEIELLVDEKDLLIHRMQLPSQVESNLRQSVAYQLSRHTPFTEEQVLFDAVVVERDRIKKQLQVDLIIVPKMRIQPVIDDICQATGIKVSRVSTAQHRGKINLLGTGQAKFRPNKNVYLLAFLLFSLLVSAISPLLHKRVVVLETKNAVVELRGEAAGIMEKKLQLEKNINVLQFLVNKRKEMPRRALIVEELSRIIPDEIYLSSLKIKDNMATLQGQGKDVVSIIEKLEASRLFSSAKFTSTVNRNAQTGLDRFSIKLDIQAEAL